MKSVFHNITFIVAIIFIASSGFTGTHPFIQSTSILSCKMPTLPQKINTVVLNKRPATVRKDSCKVIQPVKKAKEIAPDNSKNYFDGFFNYDDEKEEQSDPSLFPLLKEGINTLLNQLKK